MSPQRSIRGLLALTFVLLVGADAASAGLRVAKNAHRSGNKAVSIGSAKRRSPSRRRTQRVTRRGPRMVTPVGATFRPPRVTPLYSTPVLAGGLYGGFGGVVATPVYRSTPVFSTSAVGIRAPRVARSVGPRTNAAASAFRIRSAVGGGRRARQDPMLSRATAHAASIRARYAAD